MDEKIIYERLEEEYEKLRSEYTNVRADVLDFEDTEDKKVYDGIEDDVVKKTMFPEQYEKYKRMEELENKIEHFSDELAKKAKELYSKYKNEIKTFEDKIKTNEEKIKQTEEQIENLNKEYDELVNSKEYENGDEEALIKAEDLKGQIKQKKTLIKTLKGNIEKYKETIEHYKAEMEEVNKYYNFEDEVEKGKEDEYSPGKSDSETSEKDEVKDTGKKGKREKSGYGSYVPSGETESSSGDSKKGGVSKEDEKEVNKEKINSIVKRIKSNLPLGEDDAKVVAEVLSDPSKYKEYGISTGVFSNRGKLLLHALSKDVRRTTVSAFGKLREAKEELGNIEYQKADGKQVMKTKSLLKWNGVKKLIEDPEKEIGGENHLKKVIEANKGKELTGDAKVAFDKAKECLSKYDSLRKASKTYGEVVAERQENSRFLGWFKRNKVKTLDKAHEEVSAGTVVEEPREKTDSDPLGLKDKTFPPSERDLDTTSEKREPLKDDKEL